MTYRGYSKLRTHTALGPYGRSMPRSIGLSYGRCVSLISSTSCILLFLSQSLVVVSPSARPRGAPFLLPGYQHTYS